MPAKLNFKGNKDSVNKKPFSEEEQLAKKADIISHELDKTDLFFRTNSLINDQRIGKFAGILNRLETINERKRHQEESTSVQDSGRISFGNTDAPVNNRGSVNERSSQKYVIS